MALPPSKSYELAEDQKCIKTEYRENNIATT